MTRLFRYVPRLAALALLAAGAVQAQPATPAAIDPATDKLFSDPPKRDGGWQGLANLLEALTPSVDTSLPLTPSQITDRIRQMLDQGRYAESLDVIDRRIAQRQARGEQGTDVQLLFLRGRALSSLGRQEEAIALYRQMTTDFPELPEPWNNLAALYVKQGRLELARDALENALSAHPNYGDARVNLGTVQLLLARQAYEQAASLGAQGAAENARRMDALIGSQPAARDDRQAPGAPSSTSPTNRN